MHNLCRLEPRYESVDPARRLIGHRAVAPKGSNRALSAKPPRFSMTCLLCWRALKGEYRNRSEGDGASSDDDRE